MELIIRGLYFEQFTVGQEIVTAARTITETDVVNFAGLSGDFNFIHTNVEAAQASEFGQRIAHGMLVASVATGLAVQQGFIDGTVQAFRELTWKFSRPVFIGDTVYVRAKVKALKPLRIGGGLVTFEVRVLNQQDELTQKGQWTILMKSQEGQGS